MHEAAARAARSGLHKNGKRSGLSTIPVGISMSFGAYFAIPGRAASPA